MDHQIKCIVEGLLMAAQEPLSISDIERLLQVSNKTTKVSELVEIINVLRSDYVDRGIELNEVASGYRFQVKTEFQFFVNKLWAERPVKYSRTFLETLAIIAYKQPITRAEIEDFRGVATNSNVIRTLLDCEWITISGCKEVPGRPKLYVTTSKFLDHFNLKNLAELPAL